MSISESVLSLDNYIRFNIHPLIAMEYYVAQRSIVSRDHYPRCDLFDNPRPLFEITDFPGDCRAKINDRLASITKDNIDNYQDLHDLVMSAVAHFRNEIALRKLVGGYESPWLQIINHALVDMDKGMLRHDQLPAVCKLIPFYNFDVKLAEIAQGCDSIVATDGYFTFKNLEFIDSLVPVTKNTAGLSACFFRTENNNLLRVDLDTVQRSAVDTILELNDQQIRLDIKAGSRTMYVEDLCYYASKNIIGIGV